MLMQLIPVLHPQLAGNSGGSVSALLISDTSAVLVMVLVVLMLNNCANSSASQGCHRWIQNLRLHQSAEASKACKHWQGSVETFVHSWCAVHRHHCPSLDTDTYSGSSKSTVTLCRLSATLRYLQDVSVLQHRCKSVLCPCVSERADKS